jgi:Zn-dependent protease with chaperone function
MHLSFILLAIAAVFSIRICNALGATPRTWSNRWQRSLCLFLLPPLLLVMTALAVMLMGTDGYMLGLPVGWMGYLLALSFLGYMGLSLLGLTLGGWRSIQTVNSYRVFDLQKLDLQELDLQETAGHILDTSALFAAQVGFWNSKLVMSRGLLETFDDEQIAAVLTHEAAHRFYRDTFWFFWLGWLRQSTLWLPASEALWQELLLLRELRADRWAAQKIDALLLAETLLLVVKEPFITPDFDCAAFGTAAPIDRLEERIEALLSEVESSDQTWNIAFIWMFIPLLPLLTLLIHQCN